MFGECLSGTVQVEMSGIFAAEDFSNGEFFTGKCLEGISGCLGECLYLQAGLLLSTCCGYDLGLSD